MARTNSYNNKYILNTDGFTINAPIYQTAEEMNGSIGLSIDPAQYQAILDRASRVKGIANRAAYQTVANQSYSQMRAAQNSAAQQLRSMQSRAILNGGARGISAASQLLLQLGTSAQNANQMTELRQQQAQTYLDENAELANNAGLAVQYTDSNRQYLGGLARDRYSIDHNAATGAAQAASQIIAAREAAHAAMHAADAQAAAIVEAAHIQAAAMRP